VSPQFHRSLSQTSSGWQVTARSAILLSYVGPLQTDLVGVRGAVPIDRGA